MIAFRHTLHRLARSESGVAMTEFALAFPFMLGVGLLGLETANRTLVEMHIEQLAIQIADNASRIGEDSVLEDRKIYESEINDLFYGAHLQSTASVDIYSHGRVILSSLQVVDGTTSQQYIAWQRCMGMKAATSSYGVEGDGLSGGGIVGMGPPGLEVIAFEDDAVMFVEISYDYQPIVGDPLSFGSHEVTAIASFTVRADRDLTQIYQVDPSDPAPVARCDTYQQSGLASPN
ncbi:TadE/TadG family type IV pilus assembly protein [Erythrobacter sp. EC-HK427]|uniref:TadE/TadG family type IV pilus assembly protein n=1 Tax=Erythrobacter sp. EC-HK427 TaxID=2038396 RepID=UPI001259129B|nr:TadE/TadG family type IV pilus assembly protein [Erythrobacter sp. EC-HK427]VVT16720.1 conserved hypothetical protein [Erythrobacter sp. EC-HK427]